MSNDPSSSDRPVDDTISTGADSLDTTSSADASSASSTDTSGASSTEPSGASSTEPSMADTQPIPQASADAGKQAGAVDEQAAAPSTPAAASRPLQVGRRPGEAPKLRTAKPLSEALASQAVEQTEVAAPPVIAEVVPTPSRRDALTPDLEQEIAAALGNASIDELMSGDGQEATATGGELEADSRRRATVVKLHGDNVFFTLGGPHEGIVSVRQFKEKPNAGDSLDVIVSGFNAEDGLYELRLPGAAMDVSDWEDVEEGSVVEARVTGANTGGLECMVNTLRGFIPASQVALFRVEDFAEYIDRRLPCVVTEVNARRKNLVLSHRAVLERTREEERKEQLESLQVGTICEGIVRNIRDFGAFVDLGGLDGLIHISQLSWERVEHPSEVVSEGEKVRVRIEKINPEDGKIGLSLRSLQEHPWEKVDEQFSTGDVVKGTVTRTANFGAFVKIGPGIEGLIHISELAHHRVSRVDTVVTQGQEVEVKILSIDPQEQRISLSLKATIVQPETSSGKPSEEDELEQPREMAVPQRNEPLKGGTDRPSGGDQFGLKW